MIGTACTPPFSRFAPLQACATPESLAPLTRRPARAQATSGDNAGERPMWADHGGIDFHGRACWDAWTALKVRARGTARVSVR
jgi:acyl-CoA-binding protein